jgi:hypothetical protein
MKWLLRIYGIYHLISATALALVYWNEASLLQILKLTVYGPVVLIPWLMVIII